MVDNKGGQSCSFYNQCSKIDKWSLSYFSSVKQYSSNSFMGSWILAHLILKLSLHFLPVCVVESELAFPADSIFFEIASQHSDITDQLSFSFSSSVQKFATEAYSFLNCQFPSAMKESCVKTSFIAV